MKSAYEIAMARLEKEAPTQSLNSSQKEEIAELDNLYASKIAERQVFLEGKIAVAAGTPEEEELRRELGRELRRLKEELEDKKTIVRKAADTGSK